MTGARGAALAQVRPIVLAKGLATFVPGVHRLACGRSYGTHAPRYCYSVWLRHLVTLAASGIDTEVETVAELGPGDSLGIGLSALLTGATRYVALDAVPFARPQSNRQTLDELAGLFAARAPIPGGAELPETTPAVPSLEFPHALLERRLATAGRVDAIRAALAGGDAGGVSIRYVAPWDAAASVAAASVDLAVSQAVLEHVDDLDATYDALSRWLKPGAVMSHAIDFRSHGLTRDWYGHWTVPDALWALIRGRRTYLINRVGASEHVRRMERAGFDIVHLQRTPGPPAPRAQLAGPFRDMPEDDLRTAGCFVIARRRAA